jgi:DNA-binding GntR family transcriptional regulator
MDVQILNNAEILKSDCLRYGNNEPYTDKDLYIEKELIKLYNSIEENINNINQKIDKIKKLIE